MASANYLQQVAAETPTQFWNDSGEATEITTALANGACGVTTNPILITRTVLAHADQWRSTVREMARTITIEDIPHAVTANVVSMAADMLLNIHRKTHGAAGYVCAQCNPNNHANAQAMVDEAVRFHALRANIACKIPVSVAGLEAIEELTGRGVTTTCTTSHTVPQVMAIAAAYERGLKRRSKTGASKKPRCYAVIMAGRLDDHLRDEVKAGRGQAREEAITIAGLAVSKRAYKLYTEHGYESILLVGGMRGLYHVTDLMGGRLVLTIAPSMQTTILEHNFTLHNTISEPVANELVQEMYQVPDFRRAYEPDGMAPVEFAGYGSFVKTQGQFIENYQKLQTFITESLAQ